MGNTNQQALYDFSQEYSVLHQNNSYFILQKPNQPNQYIGKKLQTTDQQQITQIQSIIEHKINSPSPYVTKLLETKKVVKDEAPCFKPWNYFYLLFEEKQYTLNQEIQNRVKQNKNGFKEKQIDDMLERISKAIKYLYSIGHQHGKISRSAIVWPKQAGEEIKLIDRWAMEDDEVDFKEEYSTWEDESDVGYSSKQCLDLYRLGVSTIEMIYCGRHNNPSKRQVVELIKRLNNQNIKQKLEILCNKNPEQRLKIYNIFNNAPTPQILQHVQKPQPRLQTIQPQHHNFYPSNQNQPNFPVHLNPPTSAQPLRNNEVTPIKTFDSKHPTPQYEKLNKVNITPTYTQTNTSNNQPNNFNRISAHTSYRNTFDLPLSHQNHMNNEKTTKLQQNRPVSFNSSTKSNTISFGQNSYSKNLDKDNIFTSPDFFKKISSSSNPISSVNPSNSSINYAYSSTLSQNQVKTSIPVLKNLQQNIQQVPARKLERKEPSLREIPSIKQIQKQQKNAEHVININSQKVEEQNEEQNEEQVNKSKEFNTEYNTNGTTSLSQITPSRERMNITTIPELSQSANSNNEVNQDEREQVYEEYENGSKYKGYKSKLTGAKTGWGKFYYKEGSYYDGEWKDNNMHGFGKLFYANKKPAYEGQWYFDRFHGKGKVYNDEPIPFDTPFDYTNFDNLEEQWQYYQGTLVSDEKEGEGILMLSNGEYYQGEFQKDRVHGRGTFYTLSGDIIRGIWNDSVLERRL